MNHYNFIVILLSIENNQLIANIHSDNNQDFQSCVSGLKNKKFKFDPTSKKWKLNLALVQDDLYDILKLFTDKVYFPDYIKESIKNYYNLLPSELRKFEFNELDFNNFLKFPPIKGKEPFENYQIIDIKRALQQNRFLFNWEMGLGKSYATSFIYQYLKQYRNGGKMILFTSKIGTYNLRNEILKFCSDIRDDDIEVFSSVKSFDNLKKNLSKDKKILYRRIFDLDEINNKSILIFSYDSWKIISKAYEDSKQSKKLNIPLDNFYKDKIHLICFDECQKLSNPKSDRSKYIFKYLPYFDYRYEFSATPADKPEKLYSICLVLDPKLIEYLKYNEWIEKYNDVGTWFSKYAINKNKWRMEMLEDLNKKLLDYSSKRSSKECLNLPTLKNMEPIYIEMDSKQLFIYKTAVNELINKAIQEGKDNYELTDAIRESFTSILTLIENPNVIDTNNLSDKFSLNVKKLCENYDYSKNYEKLNVVDDILEDELENEKRGIIWYIHPKTLDSLKERYSKLKPICITSDLNDEERSKLVEEFKSNDSHKLLLASINIMNTSITVNEATFAIYLENTYSYENYFQSLGRIYRIGQKEDVHIWHIYYKGTIDVYSESMLSKKEDLVKTLFSSERTFLNLTQIKQLFLGEDY